MYCLRKAMCAWLCTMQGGAKQPPASIGKLLSTPCDVIRRAAGETRNCDFLSNCTKWLTLNIFQQGSDREAFICVYLTGCQLFIVRVTSTSSFCLGLSNIHNDYQSLKGRKIICSWHVSYCLCHILGMRWTRDNSGVALRLDSSWTDLKNQTCTLKPQIARKYPTWNYSN